MRIISTRALGGVPDPMAQPYFGGQTGTNITTDDVMSQLANFHERLTAIEENIRRGAAQTQQLKVGTQSAVRTLVSNFQGLVRAIQTGYAPAPQYAGATSGVPTHAIRNPNAGFVNAGEGVQTVNHTVARGATPTSAPVAVPSQQTVAQAADALFYGADEDSVFYQGDDEG